MRGPGERAARAAERAARATRSAARATERAAKVATTPTRTKVPTAGELLERVARDLCDAGGVDGADELAARLIEVWRRHYAAATEVDPEAG